MSDFTHRQTLSRDFPRVRLDERALRDVARIVAGFATRNNAKVRIVVNAANGRDSYQTSDPEFFVADEMPREVRSIEIECRDYSSGLSCEVSFGRNEYRHPGAYVSVSASNAAEVASVFTQVSQRLEGCLTGGDSFRIDDGIGTSILIACAITTLVFLTAYPVVTLVARSHPMVWTVARQLALSFGFLIFMFSLAVVPERIAATLRHAFPLVEYAGKIADDGARRRKRLVWLLSVIVLPLVLNIVAGIIVLFVPVSTK